MVDWNADLAEVRERLRLDDLDESRALASVRSAVDEWRWMDPFGGFFLPLPPVAQTIYNAHGDWRERSDSRDGRADALAVDAHGRPVAHVLDRGDTYERANHLWWWDDDGSFLEIELMGSGPHVRRARAVDGRIVHVVTASGFGQEEVAVLTWAGGRAVRADIVTVSEWAVRIAARTAEHDADGALSRMAQANGEAGSRDVAAGLAQASRLEPDRQPSYWDARVQAPEPWPGGQEALRRAAPLADALDAVLRAALAEADVLEPFVVQVLAAGDYDRPFPPRAEALPATWRDRLRRSSSQDGAALLDAYKARDAGLAVPLPVVDRLDAESLRTCRMLTTALGNGAPWSRRDAADPVAEAVGARLAQRLNGEPIPGTADPFLAFVHVGARYDDDRERHTRAAVGAARLAAFMASLASTKGGSAARVRREQAQAALLDRDALETFLRASGLEAHAARLAHEVAEPGFLLEEAEGVRSRLGGEPLLPAGEPWPDGLTFAAAIDLSELPPSGLPEHGWMLCYVGIDFDEHDGLVDVADNEPGSPARLFWTDAPVPASGPALRERRVRARALLTLPDEESAAATLGLDVYDKLTYEELVEELSDAITADWPRHWIGGHVTGAQGYDMHPGTVILLSLAYDEELEFEFLDAGTAQFRIPPEALAARDFTQVIAVADSC